jgi:hypothetical protein
MSARLQIINDALIATGNNPLTVEHDGSDEWIASESAYRRALGSLLNAHEWNFAKKRIALSSRALSSPSVLFEVAFALPTECLHVEAVYVSGIPVSNYEMAGGKLCLPYEDGVEVSYVRAPPADQWPLNFRELLTVKVEELILRGLNEEDTRADRRLGAFNDLLEQVRFQTDRQGGRRAVFKSTSALRRRGAGPRGLRWPT